MMMSVGDIPPSKREPMTNEQERHLGRIIMRFWKLVDAKYRVGQQEHGGNLFDLPEITLLDSAIDEAIDQVVYLLTLREKVTGEDYGAYPYGAAEGRSARVPEGVQGGGEDPRTNKDKQGEK